MHRFFFFLILTLFAAGSADAAWRRAETLNFIIFAEFSESDIRDYALSLERFDQLLRRFAHVDTPAEGAKFRVYVPSSAGRLRRFFDDADNTTAGAYIPSIRGPYALVPRRNVGTGRFRMTSQHILFHEYAHHFMLHYFPTSYPAWYVEGFAEFYATVEFDDGGQVEVGHAAFGRVPSLHYESWLPYQTMLSNEVANSEMTYAQGWLLIHYAMFNPPVSQTLSDYLNAVAAGSTGAEAYETTFGASDFSLDDRLRAYFRRGRLSVASFRLPFELPQVAVTELTDEQAEIALLYPLSSSDSEDTYREVAERFSGNPQAHVERAVFEIDRDDFDAAIEAADRALAIDPDHVEANVYKGVALIGAARAGGDGDDPRWALGRALALRANHADPQNAMALLTYYSSYPNSADRPDNALAALESAFHFVPQSGELRLLLGQEYLHLSRFDDALRAVLPVAQSPHDSQGRALALQIVDRARREVSADIDFAVTPEAAE